MPPRYSYWTIIAGNLPTAFRAAERDELMPTFQRIREKHPDAQLKWFQRGVLWESPEAAREASRRQDDRGRGGRPHREGGAREARGRDWRPGGEHRDPRQPYKDRKKARNLEQRRAKFARKLGPGGAAGSPPRVKPHGDARLGDRRQSGSRHGSHTRPGSRPPRPAEPRQGWKSPPPHGDRRPARPNQRTPHVPFGARSAGPRPGNAQTRRPPRDARPGKPWTSPAPRKPATRPDWRADRPSGAGPREDWRPTRKTGAGRAESGHEGPRGAGGRPFERKQFDRPVRGSANQGTDEPPPPPRPRGPDREPPPGESPSPTPPPRPSEPRVPSPGPPERGSRQRPPRTRR